MLDQSFSAHNFDIIYGLESRKGNIDIHTLPQTYLDVIKQEEDTKKFIAIEKAQKKDSDAAIVIEGYKNQLKVFQEQKKTILSQYLFDVAKLVNNKTFRFGLTRYVHEGKDCFKIDTTTHAAFFAIKQLQYNLRNVFKVGQANRHFILTNIKTFLNSSIPVYIIRTDIDSFFESIPQDKLLKKLTDGSLLSHKSKAFVKGIINEYEQEKDKLLVPAGRGVPRGVGISSYLSELYMRDLDKKISTRKEVLFYARYVDDIFIILTDLPQGRNLQEYYNEIELLFLEEGLQLKHSTVSGKCHLIEDTYLKNDVPEIAFDYLGYNLRITKTKGAVETRFGMKLDKIAKLTKRIDNAFCHFNNLSVSNIKQAHKDLIDSLNYISGNISLYKTKSGVKTGLYYSNDLLDDLQSLKDITAYLHGKTIAPHSKLNATEIAVFQVRLNKKIQEIDFEQRWKDRKMFRFSLSRIQEMDTWL